jgi:hypothetical protein
MSERCGCRPLAHRLRPAISFQPRKAASLCRKAHRSQHDRTISTKVLFELLDLCRLEDRCGLGERNHGETSGEPQARSKYGSDHSTITFASYMGHSTTNSRALQTAFMNSPVFFKLFDESAKGKPLAAGPLGSRAVLNLGVAPGSKDKFVQSFVDSAVAAGLASLNEDGQIVLAPLDVGADDGQQPSEEQFIENRQHNTSSPGRTQAVARQEVPVVHQTWAIDGGSIVFEIRTDQPLPAKAFTTVGDVVASLEHLAEALGPHSPKGGVEAEKTGS